MTFAIRTNWLGSKSDHFDSFELQLLELYRIENNVTDGLLKCFQSAAAPTRTTGWVYGADVEPSQPLRECNLDRVEPEMTESDLASVRPASLAPKPDDCVLIQIGTHKLITRFFCFYGML